jgi:hypothetical protein
MAHTQKVFRTGPAQNGATIPAVIVISTIWWLGQPASSHRKGLQWGPEHSLKNIKS